MRSRPLKTIFFCILYHGLSILLSQLSNYRKHCNFSASILIHSGMCFLVFTTFSVHLSIESASWRWLMPDQISDVLFGLPHRALTDLTICLQMMTGICLIVAAVGSVLYVASLPVLSSKLLMIYRFWTVLKLATDPSFDRQSTSAALAQHREQKKPGDFRQDRATATYQLDRESRDNGEDFGADVGP